MDRHIHTDLAAKEMKGTPKSLLPEAHGYDLQASSLKVLGVAPGFEIPVVEPLHVAPFSPEHRQPVADELQQKDVRVAVGASPMNLTCTMLK